PCADSNCNRADLVQREPGDQPLRTRTHPESDVIRFADSERKKAARGFAYPACELRIGKRPRREDDCLSLRTLARLLVDQRPDRSRLRSPLPFLHEVDLRKSLAHR